MTTIGETPLEPYSCGGPDMPDPMRDWLAANDISIDRVVMWPQIEIDRETNTIKVEYIYNLSRGRTELLLRKPATHMVSRPLLVEPDQAMWDAYQHSRPQALARELVELLGRSGATVIRPREGDALMFVTSDRYSEQGQVEGSVDLLSKILPGVNITIVAGFDCVMHRDGPA